MVKKNIVAFNFISDPQIIKEIIESKINKISQSILKEKNIRLIYGEEFIINLTDILASNFNHEYGGRGIITELETILIDTLSIYIFENYNKLLDFKNQNKIFDINLSICKNKIQYN